MGCSSSKTPPNVPNAGSTTGTAGVSGTGEKAEPDGKAAHHHHHLSLLREKSTGGGGTKNGTTTGTGNGQHPGTPGEETPTSTTPAPKLMRQSSAPTTRHFEGVQGSLISVTPSMSEFDGLYETRGELIGSGITGQVEIVRSKRDNQLYAMKSLNIHRLDPRQADELRNEIELLSKLDHPNIIRLISVFDDGNTIRLVMERCSGGDLSRRLFTTEYEVASVIDQIVRAIGHCHYRNVIHRDLKLENVLFLTPDKKSPIKLIDFGLSRARDLPDERDYYVDPDSVSNPAQRLERLMETVCGTAYYMAPEMLNRSYTSKADIWSIGVIAYMLFTGRAPFEGSSEAVVFRKIRRGQADFDGDIWNRVSPGAKEFVKSCLIVNPDVRPSADELLNMKWLSDFEKMEMDKLLNLHNELTDGIAESLTRYSLYTEMRKAALMVVAHHLNQDKVRELRNIFLAMDTEHTGMLTIEELNLMLIKFGGGELTEEFVTRIFNDLDRNKTGLINYMEFLAATVETICRLDAQALSQAFDHLDAHHEGIITKQDLSELLGDKYSQDDIEKMMRQCDCNGATGINREKFLSVMRAEFDQKRVQALDDLKLFKKKTHADAELSRSGYSTDDLASRGGGVHDSESDITRFDTPLLMNSSSQSSGLVGSIQLGPQGSTTPSESPPVPPPATSTGPETATTTTTPTNNGTHVATQPSSSPTNGSAGGQQKSGLPPLPPSTLVSRTTSS